jgi:hypothetical protein
MTEWTVRIEGSGETITEDLAEALVDALAAYAPAVSYGHGRIAATLSVQTPTPQQALAEALAAFTAAAAAVVVSHVEADRAA